MIKIRIFNYSYKVFVLNNEVNLMLVQIYFIYFMIFIFFQIFVMKVKLNEFFGILVGKQKLQYEVK